MWSRSATASMYSGDGRSQPHSILESLDWVMWTALGQIALGYSSLLAEVAQTAPYFFSDPLIMLHASFVSFSRQVLPERCGAIE